MIPMLQQRLLRYVDEHASSSIDHWHHLYTQLYTLSAQKIQEVMITWLRAMGFSMRFLADDRSLVCMETGTINTARTAQTLLLYLPLSASPPASLALHIATIFASYQAAQAALNACRDICGPPVVNIKWLFDSQSVLSRRDLSSLVAEHREALHASGCLCYVPEQAPRDEVSAPAVALGTRGSLSVELRVQSRNMQVEAQYGGVAPNAAWQLLWALNAVKDQREDILIEGFYDALWSIEDAVFDALATMADTVDISSPDGRWGLQESLLGLQGRQHYYAYFLTPTCSVTYLHAGQMPGDQQAYIPSLASAHLDFQLVPVQDPLDLYAKLQRHLLNEGHTGVQTQLLHASHPTYTPLSSPFVQSVIQATTAAYGRSPRLLPLISTAASLYPLQEQLALPIVLIPSFLSNAPQDLAGSRDTESFIAHIKQAALMLAGGTLANETAL